MNFKKVWIAEDVDVSEEQLKLCSSDIILAKLLKKRGIDTKEKIESFLNPLKVKLLPPDVFTDIDKAVQRIQSAVKNAENITVYGDFDADGITSAAILFMTLKQIGANASYYLPDRAAESHGLNTKALVNIISKNKSKLIITVDCGISNAQEVKFAKGFGADVIITDHHEAPEILPQAFAIINPKAPDAIKSDLSVDELQSLNYLAGVGVVFKLCCRLLELYNSENFVNKILPLVAIGTIGDVVELLGENRTLVAMGLELIKRGENKGISKLLGASNISDLSKLTSENVAFGIVPRLNAAGRLDSPYTAFDLLVSDDDVVLDDRIKTLNDLNSLRQQLCDETFSQACEMYEKDKQNNKKSIILYNQNWHVGIIGIVASKLVEAYNKPVFLMTQDVNNPNIIRCSSRSIEQMNIHQVLSEHKDLFEGFGGHKMAAGFSFDINKISFEKLKNLLNITIDEQTQNVDFSQVKIYADLVVNPEDITLNTINNIKKMEPFGSANTSPLFIMNDVILKQSKMMGQNNNHLKIFAQKNNIDFECIKWNTPDFSLPEGSKLDILFYLQTNEYNGNITIQYLLMDMHSENMQKQEQTSKYKILDHRNKKNIFDKVLEFASSTQKNTAIYVNSSNLNNMILKNEEVFKKCFDFSKIPENIEQLMFFEAPLNSEQFREIIHNTGADFIHLMNFNPDVITIDSAFLKLSGMLKYSINKLNGKFNILQLAKALNLNEEIVCSLLDILEDVNMIKLEHKDQNEYCILSLTPVEFSQIKKHEIYNGLENEIEEINNFKNFYMNADVCNIKEIIE